MLPPNNTWAQIYSHWYANEEKILANMFLSHRSTERLIHVWKGIFPQFFSRIRQLTRQEILENNLPGYFDDRLLWRMNQVAELAGVCNKHNWFTLCNVLVMKDTQRMFDFLSFFRFVFWLGSRCKANESFLLWKIQQKLKKHLQATRWTSVTREITKNSILWSWRFS